MLRQNQRLSARTEQPRSAAGATHALQSPARIHNQLRRSPSMRWQDLVITLASHVPPGRVTTYAEVSAWGYGKRNLNQPV